jgi:hypothetical protein
LSGSNSQGGRPDPTLRARLIRLRIATIAVLTLLLLLFVTFKNFSSRVRSAVPEYAPIIDRLPGYQPQAGDPIYFHFSSHVPTDVDTAAIRRAGRLVPDDATYFVQAPESSPSTQDVVLAARLFFLPAVLSVRADMVGWILSYRSPSIPPGFRSTTTYRLDKDLLLIKLQRR